MEYININALIRTAKRTNCTINGKAKIYYSDQDGIVTNGLTADIGKALVSFCKS